MTKTTISIDSAILKRLARRKVHPRESYTAVLKRLLKRPALTHADVDEIESIIETVDIISDPETMRRLAKSMDDFKAGRLHSIDEV